MHELDRLVRQIRRNCDISDARHGGIFSICGLALRLRDLYKWEQGVAPWDEGDPAALLEWIGQKEELWEGLAGLDYGLLALAGREVDPFDADAVNSFLAPHRLYYGAGYARGLKPTFFLAAIDQRRVVEGHTVYALGRELARDLLTLPALSQGDTIMLRRDSACRYLWDQLSYIEPSGRRALSVALDACGLADHRPSALRGRLAELLRVQEALHMHHELGELQETHFGRDLWREIIAAFALTRIEVLVRHVKDLLADTSVYGTLRYVCRTRSTAGLALYLACADRLSKALVPQLELGFENFLRTQDWATVERAVEDGYAAAAAHADAVIGAYGEGKGRNDLAFFERTIQRIFGEYLDGQR